VDASIIARLSLEVAVNQTAGKELRISGTRGAAQTDSLTLRVIDGSKLQAVGSAGPAKYGENHFLLSVLPLESATTGSTLARRLRLKDSLAGGAASRKAGILAKDPHFWNYLHQINLAAYDAEIDARRARHFINRACNVCGRHELDREAGAAQRFFRLVEQPFLTWLFAGESV